MQYYESNNTNLTFNEWKNKLSNNIESSNLCIKTPEKKAKKAYNNCISPMSLKKSSTPKKFNLAKSFLSNFNSDNIYNYPVSKVDVYSQKNKDFIIFPTIELTNYWYNNNLDDNILYEATDNLKLANLILNSEEFINISSEFKKYVLIASFLSNNKLDKSKNDILKIFNMPYLDYVNNIMYTGDDCYWKLIPKYISILNKVGNVGIFKFYNYCVEHNSRDIHYDMKNYISIVKNFKNNFNNKFVVELMNMRIEQIKSFETTLEKINVNLSKDMIYNLFN
jgi:hypothetical protein